MRPSRTSRVSTMPRILPPKVMAERNADFDLLLQVVGGVQQHVSELRGHVVGAAEALGALDERTDDGLTASERLRSARDELSGALERLADLQLLLTAAAQEMALRDHARGKLKHD